MKTYSLQKCVSLIAIDVSTVNRLHFRFFLPVLNRGNIAQHLNGTMRVR